MRGTMLLMTRYLIALLIYLYTAHGALQSRVLGGYERLLSRLTPSTNRLSLSHASAVLLSDEVDHDALISSVSIVMAKHPMLRSFISRVGGEDGSSGNDDMWMHCSKPLPELAGDVVTTVRLDESADFDQTWQSIMQESLNNAEFSPDGPLWRLTNIICSKSNSAAWVFCVNHGADDQGSINLLVNDLVRVYNALRRGKSGSEVGAETIGSPIDFPPSMEDAMVQGAQFPLPSTLGWALFQMYNSLQLPAMLPKHISDGPKRNEPAFFDPNNRETFCEFFELDAALVTSLRKRCRKRGITVTSALSAAMLSVTSHAIQTLGDSNDKALSDEKLRFLLSVDLRPYGSGGEADWTRGTVACAAGAVDYVVPVTKAVSATAVETAFERPFLNDVWMLAERCQQRSDDIINKKRWVPESVRLFGFGMRYAKILPLVEDDAKSRGSLGRGFSCGVSNMGLAQFVPSAEKKGDREKGGLLSVKRVHYGTSHARNGVLCQLSCMSVASADSSEAPFCGTLQFTSPLIEKEEAALWRKRLVSLVGSLAHD